MPLIDEAIIKVFGGAGGNGCISFRREKYVPFGGPNGGNGGNGGSVLLEASRDKGSLLDFKFRPEYKAERGEHGMGKDMDGRTGESLRLKVPLGTMVYDAETGALLADLVLDGDTYCAAGGGRGGRGNKTFATSTNRAPKYAQPGEAGHQTQLKLELRLIADVGLVGLPNAGKSSFLASVTRATPKIAAYPFTTLEPQLGVAQRLDRTITFADLPGLIEGAAEGVGLGIKFLKHVARNRVLLHLVECQVGADAIEQRLQTVQRELAAFSERLAALPQILVFSKSDLLDEGAREALAEALRARGIVGHFYSSASRFGEIELLDAVTTALRAAPAPRPESVPPEGRIEDAIDVNGMDADALDSDDLADIDLDDDDENPELPDPHTIPRENPSRPPGRIV